MLILTARQALTLREVTGRDVRDHPDFAVWDPDAPVIEIRPGTVDRMRMAADLGHGSR